MPITAENAQETRSNRQQMKVIPQRVTFLQFELLDELRQGSGLSIQEHVRRAIDIYLAGVRKPEPPRGPSVVRR